MSDLQATIYTIVTVLVFLVFSEGMAKTEKISKETARKLIHISVGNVIFFVPLFETRLLAAGIPFLFVFGNFLLSPLSPIEKMRLKTFKAGHAWGTILYPLSLSLSVYVFFSQPWLIVATFFPVVYGDGLAAVFGPKAKSGKFTIFGNSKTLIGTAIISLFSWASTFLGVYYIGFSFELAVTTGLLVGILTPFIELLSPRGTDNLVIPVVLMVLLGNISSYLEEKSTHVVLMLYLIGLILGLIFAIGGYLAKALTPDGAVVGFMITQLMLGVGNLAIGVQLFLFFILGSVATKLVSKRAGETQDEFEKGGERRDAIQAMAKAGLPAILSYIFLLSDSELVFYIISGIMTAALIDTMATEIGIAMKGHPFYPLAPWVRAEPGQTGVISIQGSIGGVISGSLFVLISAVIAMNDPYKTVMLSLSSFLWIILLTGSLGMLSDSIIGGSIQRSYRCSECGKIVESKIHHNKETVPEKGIRWFNNDLTNFTATSLAGLFTYLLFLFVF